MAASTPTHSLPLMFVEPCPLGTGKYLLWKGAYWQNHYIRRDQMLGEFDTQQLAEGALARLGGEK